MGLETDGTAGGNFTKLPDYQITRAVSGRKDRLDSLGVRIFFFFFFFFTSLLVCSDGRIPAVQLIGSNIISDHSIHGQQVSFWLTSLRPSDWSGSPGFHSVDGYWIMADSPLPSPASWSQNSAWLVDWYDGGMRMEWENFLSSLSQP